MRNGNLDIPYNLPTTVALELVKQLTVGQRTTGTVDALREFLHREIFPQLGPFAFALYTPSIEEASAHLLSTPQKSQRHRVPERFPLDDESFTRLLRSQQPSVFTTGSPFGEYLDPTGNTTHLLIPIGDDEQVTGLVYIGSRDTLDFGADFITTCRTIGAVIGSRLKSMNTIIQLKESMAALEHSEKLRTTLYEISEQAHMTEDLHELYAILHDSVGRLIYAKNFFIALVEEQQGRKIINFPYYVDQQDPQFQGMALTIDSKQYSISSYLIASRQPLLLVPENFDRFCQQHNIRYLGSRPYSWLGAPFYTEHLAGAVAVQSYQKVMYTEKDKMLMAFVAHHIGGALSRKRAIDELKKAKENAERAERNKSIFLANMSHEIRTPMNGILGLTDLLLSSNISGKKRTYLEMIQASSHRLLKLVNDILDFSKIEAGKLQLQQDVFSLRQVIDETMGILRLSAEEKNIELMLACDHRINDRLIGDGDKLGQVLLNLLGNGIKFTKEGSVELLVEDITPQHRRNGSINLHFQIRDTGIGIPKEKLDSVFQAFSQLDATRDSNNRGTGLGLVIAAELVEIMGGHISVASQAGVGTTFHFTLYFEMADKDEKPLAENEQRAVHLESPTAGRPLKLLLVEDEYINRTLGTTVLEQEGYEVSVAENGIEALEQHANQRFDLILMDIQMPKLNGYETTKAIRHREKKNLAHTPIIAMTAYAVKGDREKCLAAGMNGYIAKPINRQSLRREIDLVLKQQTRDGSLLG